VKKHPDCQPCGTVTVDGGDDYDGDADEQFERKGIYDKKPLVSVVGDFGIGTLVFDLCTLFSLPY